MLICKRVKSSLEPVNIYVVVQFYPWFKFYFPLMSLKQRKIKLKPRIKLNHNIHIKYETENMS